MIWGVIFGASFSTIKESRCISESGSKQQIPSLHEEAFRLDSQCGLMAELVGRISHLNLEALENKSDIDDHLLFGESAANAASHSHAKGMKGIRRKLAEVKHTLWLEHFRIISVNLWVGVVAMVIDYDWRFLTDKVLSAKDYVFLGMPRACSNGSIQTQRFLETGVNVLELGQVLRFNGAVAQDFIDLLYSFL